MSGGALRERNSPAPSPKLVSGLQSPQFKVRKG